MPLMFTSRCDILLLNTHDADDNDDDDDPTVLSHRKTFSKKKWLIISSKKINEHTTYTCKTCKKDMDGSCFLINLNRVMYALIKQEDIDWVLRILSMYTKTIIRMSEQVLEEEVAIMINRDMNINEKGFHVCYAYLWYADLKMDQHQIPSDCK